MFKLKAIPFAVMTALAGAALAPAAHADQVSDLKAEIEAQKRMAAEQQARLDALEKRLNETQAQQQQQAANKPAITQASLDKHPVWGTPGYSGLTYQAGADTVSLYGLLDITGSSINNTDATGRTQTSFHPVGWFSGSRWGINGSHMIGDSGNTAVIFRLESEYELNTGGMDTPGVLFNRDAWLGLQNDTLGKLTFGRQNTLARDFSQNYGDPYGSPDIKLEEGGWTNANNFKQLIFYAGGSNSTRYNRGIVWKKKLDNFVLGLGYSAPTTLDNTSPTNNKTESAALAYNGGPFNLATFYNQATVGGLTHQAYSIGGNVQVAKILRLNAGYFHYTANQAGSLGQRKDNAYTLSAKLAPGGKFDYELGYQVMKASNAGYNASGATLNAFADTSSVTSVGTGDKKTVYVSMFYHWDPRTDLYLAADYMRLGGGYVVAATNGHNSQTEVATGIRYKF